MNHEAEIRLILPTGAVVVALLVKRGNGRLDSTGGAPEPHPRFRHLARVVASLPCYSQRNVDSPRGAGVFERRIAALRRRNGLGYGVPDSGLTLDLVYNPLGPTLPPAQAPLEADYTRELGLPLALDGRHRPHPRDLLERDPAAAATGR